MGYSLSGVRNIGWLDKDVAFGKGISDILFVDKLAEIILFKESVRCYVVNAIRGYHRCNLCNKEMVTYVVDVDNPESSTESVGIGAGVDASAMTLVCRTWQECRVN